MVDNVGVTLDNAQHPVRIGDDTLLFGAMSSDGWWKMVSTDMEGKMKETRHIAVPKGPNTAAPDGFQEKDGSGRCKCRGNGKGLNSCGGLCCAASPFTALNPTSKYYYAKGGSKSLANLCYEDETGLPIFHALLKRAWEDTPQQKRRTVSGTQCVHGRILCDWRYERWRTTLHRSLRANTAEKRRQKVLFQKRQRGVAAGGGHVRGTWSSALLRGTVPKSV